MHRTAEQLQTVTSDNDGAPEPLRSAAGTVVNSMLGKCIAGDIGREPKVYVKLFRELAMRLK
jgi:hypothetical protein